MEWALSGASVEAVSALRREIVAYLKRHAEPDADVAGAEIVVAEVLANAFEHAPGPAWVRVSWTGERPRLEVHDLGPGFVLDPELPQPAAEGGRGLFLVNALADGVEVLAKRQRGAKLRVTLPVRRRVQASHDPPRRSGGALPPLEEAREDGTFGKEAFLRALAVELAQAMEARHGPDSAEAVVAQVGANVGGRMEEAYRAARGIAGRLSPAQLADLYVRLKSAIGGSFRVIDADERRIVLGSHHCPFGPVVQRQPGLCRMTSSVFGGIAARNAGPSAVVLEERIALGDPQCRVVVWLGDGAPPDPDSAHHYAAPIEGTDAEPATREFLEGGEYVDGPEDPLTRREREIVTLIAESHTGKEIADKLVISEKTVERHRGNILRKLGLRDRVALTRYALRRGLVEA